MDDRKVIRRELNAFKTIPNQALVPGQAVKMWP
jgi:hypothetical protein